VLITREFREKYPFTCSLYKVAILLNVTRFVKSRFVRQVTEQHGHTRRGAMFAWQTAPHWLHIKLTVRCQAAAKSTFATLQVHYFSFLNLWVSTQAIHS